MSANAYEFPPYQGLTLKIEGNVTESYSNNLTFASESEERIEDYLTMLRIGLNTRYESKRHSFEFNGLLSRRIKTETSDIQNSSENLALNFHNDISEYDSLNIRNTYTHSQLPGSFQGEFDMNNCRDELGKTGMSISDIYTECNRYKDEFGRVNAGFDTYNNSLYFVYNKSISEQFDFGTSYAYGQNWSNRQGRQDSKNNNLNLNINYLYSELTRFSLSYGYVNTEYENGNVISTDTVGAGVNQYLTKRLFVNGAAGLVFQPDTTNTTFSASINDEIDEKTFATLSYARAIDISTDTDNIFRNWQVTGQLNRQLQEDLGVSFSAFYGEGEYDPWGIKDTFVGGNASMNYAFWENKRGAKFSGTLGYTYSELNSTDDSRDYDRTSVETTLTATF